MLGQILNVNIKTNIKQENIFLFTILKFIFFIKYNKKSKWINYIKYNMFLFIKSNVVNRE